MSPKSPIKAVTPGSVKVLMLVEAGIIGFLSYWIANEYIYNAYFHTYIDQAFASHVTTYTAILGLGVGLAGSAVAIILYKNLRKAENQLGAIGPPRFRGTVDRILAGLPALDERSSSALLKEILTGEEPNTLESPPAVETESPNRENESDAESG